MMIYKTLALHRGPLPPISTHRCTHHHSEHRQPHNPSAPSVTVESTHCHSHSCTHVHSATLPTIINDAITQLSDASEITLETLEGISRLFHDHHLFQPINGDSLTVHQNAKIHGHHPDVVSIDHPKAALSIIMNTIDKHLIEKCLCAPIDLDELGGAIRHLESAVNSLNNPETGSHSHTILDHPSGLDIGFAVASTYFALFGIYFGILNIKNSHERLTRLNDYQQKVSDIIDNLEKATRQIPQDQTETKHIMSAELKNMRTYLSEIEKSKNEAKIQIGVGATMAGGSGAIIGSLFLATMTPISTILFSLYGLAHVGKFSLYLGQTLNANHKLKHTENSEALKKTLKPFFKEKYKVYSGLIGCFSSFTAASVTLSVGALAGATAVGGPAGLATAALVLITAALSAAYLNNVSANRFAPKNQDHKASRLLWGSPTCVSSSMEAYRELRDIAQSTSKKKRKPNTLKWKDYAKCGLYWCGTIATLGTLPKFFSKASAFKTRFDVSRSQIHDLDRRELMTKFCKKLIENASIEQAQIEEDIKSLIKTINTLTEPSLEDGTKELLIKQLTLKQLALNKHKNESEKATYIIENIDLNPGAAYTEFLRLTHMDVHFVQKLEIMKKSKHISETNISKTPLTHSESLSYLGDCGHSHGPGRVSKFFKRIFRKNRIHPISTAPTPKAFEISINIQKALQHATDASVYKAVLDHVIKTDLVKEMDEQWIKRGNHLQALLLLKP